MSSARRDKGRSLFPFGPNGAPQDTQNIAFSLLRAVPFTQRGSKSHRVLNWSENALAARLLNCPADSLPRTESELIDLIPPEYQRARRNALEGLTSDGSGYTIIYALVRKDAPPIWVRETGQRLKGEGAAPGYIASVLQDVTEAEKTKMQIEHDYRYEPLTGCLNKHYFEQVLSHQQAAGYKPQIINIQIDNQDDVLEIYGPYALDYVFEALSKRIMGELSPNDFTAFDMKTHFQILLSGVRAEDILSKSKKFKFILGEIPVESPFGIITPDCRVSIKTPRAIEAEPGDHENAITREPTVSRAAKPLEDVDILIALEQDRFRLAFQPIKSARAHDTAYYEALLRYRQDDGALISAFPYIALAERLGLIDRLDRRALKLARRTLELHPDVKLSLNVSVGTLCDDETIEAYLSELESFGRKTQNITIELTETLALESLEQANQFSARIQALGCQLAVDDFGAGHTSFHNLLGLEAQIVKIDGSYIRDIALSREKQNFVRMMAEMAQVFGLKTVAEMIDNEADCTMCERLGVDFLQGFWLGRPRPI